MGAEFMVWPKVILGIVLLVFGRKLFWLFVGIAGFFLGMEYTGMILMDQPQWVIMVVAIAVGLVGAILAIVAERLAFALAGFYAGAYLALLVAQIYAGLGQSTVFFFAGGLIGAIIAALVMDWAIIIFSSLVGGGAIVQALSPGQTAGALMFVVLVAIGVAIQAKMLKGTKGAKAKKAK